MVDTLSGTDILDLNDIVGSDIWAETRTAFPIADPGSYNAEVETVEGPMKNRAGDGYILKVRYRILDEPFAGVAVFQNISLKPQALWKLQEFLRAMGREEGDTTYEPGEFNRNMCVLEVGTRTYDGKESNEVKKVHEPGSLDTPAVSWT